MEAGAISQIYRNGKHYDQLFGLPNTAFWIARAQETGGPVLELGCGTGLISIPLSEAGFEVVGIDLAPSMLDEARRKSENQNLNVKWIHDDIRSFALQRLFNLIILPSNNLSHLLDINAVERCFDCVKAHLAPAGRFVIDVFMPNLKLLVQDPAREDILSEYDDPDGGGRVIVKSKSIYEPHTQIRRNTTISKRPGHPGEVGQLDMKMFFPQELETLLRYRGFQVISKYGSYDQAPFGPSSNKQLIIAAHSPV